MTRKDSAEVAKQLQLIKSSISELLGREPYQAIKMSPLYLILHLEGTVNYWKNRQVRMDYAPCSRIRYHGEYQIKLNSESGQPRQVPHCNSKQFEIISFIIPLGGANKSQYTKQSAMERKKETYTGIISASFMEKTRECFKCCYSLLPPFFFLLSLFPMGLS